MVDDPIEEEQDEEDFLAQPMEETQDYSRSTEAQPSRDGIHMIEDDVEHDHVCNPQQS